MNKSNERTSTSSYHVASWEVIIIAISIPAVGYLLQMFSHTLRILLLSLFTPGASGYLLYLPTLLILGLIILPLLLFIFTTCFELCKEPSNPANLTFSCVLFGGGVLSLASLVYIDYLSKPLHELRYSDFSTKWGLVSFMIFLALVYFIHYDKDSSKEEEDEREASFYESPVELASRKNEWEAQQIVNRLHEEEIDARLEGTQSLAFDDIETMSEKLRILVSEEDLEEAQNILDEFEEGSSEAGE